MAQASKQSLLCNLRSAGGAVYMQQLQRAADEAQRRVVEHAARAAAVQATARAAASQAARAELASMRSAAQSEATALNEAEITYFTTQVQSLAARMTRFHAYRRARLSLRRQLRYGALGCTCSHATVYDGATDISDEDVRQALALGHANVLSLRASQDASQKLLASEQRQQESWGRESPSTDALYEYVAQLADSWLYLLARPVNAAFSAAQVATLKEKWQAHAKTACLGHAHCMQLRQWLVHEEPAAVEAAPCRAAVKCACGSMGESATGHPGESVKSAKQLELPGPMPIFPSMLPARPSGGNL